MNEIGRVLDFIPESSLRMSPILPVLLHPSRPPLATCLHLQPRSARLVWNLIPRYLSCLGGPCALLPTGPIYRRGLRGSTRSSPGTTLMPEETGPPGVCSPLSSFRPGPTATGVDGGTPPVLGASAPASGPVRYVPHHCSYLLRHFGPGETANTLAVGRIKTLVTLCTTTTE